MPFIEMKCNLDTQGYCQVTGFDERRLLRKEKKGANFIPWLEPGT